jgi:TatD DNase family protein
MNHSGDDAVDFTLVDSHCHLNLAQFDPDREAVIAEAVAHQVRVIVNPGIDLETSRQAVELAESSPHIYAAVGVHPNSSDTLDGETLERLRSMASHPKVVAIGEIGLDYYWDRVSPEVQAAGFQAQLELAADVGLPVIIHNRDAHDHVARTLEAWVKSERFRQSALAQRPYPGILHAFGGPLALAEAAYSWNFLLGLGGPITFVNARELHALVPQLRIDRIVVETDAPYLSPHPYRGKRNEPAKVRLVAEQMAHLFGRSLVEIAESTTALARTFFALPNADDPVERFHSD